MRQTSLTCRPWSFAAAIAAVLAGCHGSPKATVTATRDGATSGGALDGGGSNAPADVGAAIDGAADSNAAGSGRLAGGAGESLGPAPAGAAVTTTYPCDGCQGFP